MSNNNEELAIIAYLKENGMESIELDDLEYFDSEYYGLSRYEVRDSTDVYCVGTTSEFDEALVEYVKVYCVEEDFLENFKYLENYIDDDELYDVVFNDYYDMIRYNPDGFFEDSERELSSEQVEIIEILNNRIGKYRRMLSNLPSGEIGDKKETEINDVILRLKNKIEDIEQSPDGEFHDERIREVAKSIAEDKIQYEFNLVFDDYIIRNVEQFVDIDKLANDLAKEESYEELSINNEVFEIKIDNEYYHVIKTE